MTTRNTKGKDSSKVRRRGSNRQPILETDPVTLTAMQAFLEQLLGHELEPWQLDVVDEVVTRNPMAATLKVSVMAERRMAVEAAMRTQRAEQGAMDTEEKEELVVREDLPQRLTMESE